MTQASRTTSTETPTQYPPVEHPNAGLVLALGIIGVLPFGFSVICGVAAWYMGWHIRKDIAGGKRFLWSGKSKWGYWLGKISTIVYAVVYLAVLFYALAAQLG